MPDNRLMQLAGGFDPNNAATIPEWMLQTLNAGQGAGQFMNDLAARSAALDANPLSNDAIRQDIFNSAMNGNISAGLGHMIDYSPARFIGNGAQTQFDNSATSHQESDALRNLLLQRMMGGQSLPGAQPGTQGGAGLPPSLVNGQ